MNEWDRLKAALAAKISAEAVQSWLSRTYQRRADPSTLWIAVPDRVTKDYVEQSYADQIRQAIVDLGLPFHNVVYEVEIGTPAPSLPSGAEPVFASAVGQLNPRFTFESFVVGSCNQFAHAAARAVAGGPARKYNPLFIYGGTGMGKTHLMHAIGRTLLQTNPGMRIVYTSSERFMNEMIGCIRSERMAHFQRHYRSADVLLVDDIHILGGKERTQEEFFHTFNELYDHQRQIVISSDSAPKNISGLVERLRSRFEWGLMVDVQAPDLETKMAILDRKAEMEQTTLPEDVRIFIATRVKSNVRELEGALVKLIAYSSVTESSITLPMAQQVLKYLGGSSERRVSMESINRVVAEHFHVQPSQLRDKSNTHAIAYPRQIAMFLIKQLTDASLPEIGRAFNKHHTTVLHSVQKIEKLRQKDADLHRLLNSLIDKIH